MKKSKLLLLLFLLCITCNFRENVCTINLPEITIDEHKEKIIKFDKNNIKDYLPELILAAVVNHECHKNAEITEKTFIMEALWNRKIHNFNNNGYNLHEQLLAPKQFTGLFIYRTKEFCVDIEKDKNIIKIAREIIYKNKRIYPEKVIFYWAGENDGKHRKWVLKRKIKTIIKTKNIFA